MPFWIGKHVRRCKKKSEWSPKPHTVTSNPAAENLSPGTGALQDAIQKKLGINDNHGVYFQGAWIGDTNQLFSGGIPEPKRNTLNSVLLTDLTIDLEKMEKWRGGRVGAEFLQVNTQNTNGQAGSVQGYNSLPGPPPLNRSELYELWYRQAFFDDKLFVRAGKTIATLDFNNVIKPVPLNANEPTIPAVNSLLYTPIFVNPTMLGVISGYYNSAYGVTVDFTPTPNWYTSYAIYDGNLANGTQTGLTGPHFNGASFQIAETGADWILGKTEMPGNIGIGGWHQNGRISQPPLLENEASGVYLFGAQRVWYKNPGIDSSGISIFYQYGFNNSDVLPMNQYVGGGFTAFGLISSRLEDSIGFGAAQSWLNQNTFQRKTELMFQTYYQAKLVKDIYLEPALSYIPNPGASPDLSAAWAGTLRAIILF